MKKLMMLALIGFVLNTVGAVNVFTSKVYFESNVDKLRENQIETDVLNAQLFYLIGHADLDGDDAYNMELSKRRVDNVKKVLIAKGANPNKIYCSYYGEQNNKDKTSEEGKAESRIVEIKYIKDPLLSHDVPKQSFIVDSKNDMRIVGNEGTIINIPANSFSEPNVKLLLQEFYKPLDILSANLSTLSNNQVLETGGMIYLEAWSNGKEVKPKNALNIEFAKELRSDDFLLFEGKTQDNLSVDWVNSQGSGDVAKDNAILYDSYYGWMYWYQYSEEDEALAKEFTFRFINCLANKLGKTYRDIMDSTKVELNVAKNGDVSLKSYDIRYGTKLEKDEMARRIIGSCEAIKAKPSSKNWSFNFTLDTIPMRAFPMSYTDNLSSNVFQNQSLGWINCDRYVKDQNLTTYKVEVAPESNVRMIVKEYKSYFNSYYADNNAFLFNNIPLEKEVVLVATLEKNGKYYLAIENTKVGKDVFKDFNYQEYTLDEMIDEIGRIKL